jgi:hypothetical protein
MECDMKAAILLYRVVDRASFIEFVKALAAEPVLKPGYLANTPTAAEFLNECLHYFNENQFHKPAESPSWRNVAELFYYGKYYAGDVADMEQDKLLEEYAKILDLPPLTSGDGETPSL